MRVARGACWVIVAILIAGACLVFIDVITSMPAWARVIGLAAWLTGFGVLVWRLVARRLPADPSTSARHAKTELPGNIRAAAAAALSLAACLAAATLFPGAGEHIRRMAMPWARSSGPVLYRVKVTAGDSVIRRGEPVTLSAYAEKLDLSAATPVAATLVWRDRNGAESSVEMTGDGTGAFHVTRPEVIRAFEYRVEMGGSSSDWFSVVVLDPVDPTSESRIELVPPEYAPAGIEPAGQAWGPLSGLQYSTATLHLRFSQPAATAFLEWRDDGGGATALIPLVLDAERRSGAASFRLMCDGTLKLVTVVESMGKSLRSEFPVRVHVVADVPPRFERMIGLSPRPRTARPDSRVQVAFTAVDDLAIGAAILEYTVGTPDAKVESVPVPFSSVTPGRADGRIDFDLAGRARAGDIIRLRLRVDDTRRLDQPDLRPQSALYPVSGWSIVRVDPAAPPLDEQDIVAQRNCLDDPLVSTLEVIKSAQTEIARIRGDTSGKTELPLDQAVRLSNTRDGLHQAVATVRSAARECGLTLELKHLASQVMALADGQLKAAEESLKRAATNHPADRAVALASALDSLRGAMGQADRLLSVNHRIARARLDRKAIVALEMDQTAVANLAQPGGAIRTEELGRLERELHARLRKLIADSDALRGASEAAKEDELRRLLLALRELAGFIRDLDAAVSRLETETRRSLLSIAAQTQRRIMSQAAILFARSESAARLASIDLPTTKDLAHTTDLIESGRTVEALTDLEARVQAFETVAATMEKWAGDHRDPKVAARQLAVWQEDLLGRFRAATKDNAANFPSLPEAARAAIREEQIALQVVAKSLPIPASAELRRISKELAMHLSIANGLTEPARAETAMTRSAEFLIRLAEAIPTIPDRLVKARADFAPIVVAQEAILLEVEQSIRGSDAARKLPGLVERQLRQMQSFNALDIPGADARRLVIAAAFGAAARDLRDAVASDALASQQWLKREFDRLRLVVDGQPASDDRAEELSRKLIALLRSMDELGPSFTQRQLQAYSADATALARQVVSLGISAEAAVLASDARSAALQLEAAARDAVQKPEEFQSRLRSAVVAGTRLAARLTSDETDLDRVRRLASSRWAEWEKARAVQGRPHNPDVSAEARRQLGRESDELVLTRVGFAGQALKKSILDQYHRLKDHDAPDRQGGPLRGLAQSLDELAALMADVDDLCAPVDRTVVRRLPAAVEQRLPSSALADSFRGLASEYRALRRRIARANDEALALIRPAGSNPIAAVEREQRELAAAITTLARQLEREHDDATALVLEGAIQATLAADGLAVGMLAPASGSAERAGQALRRAATQGGTKAWVKGVADLAAKQDAARARMSESRTPADVAAQQQARGEELARRAGTLAKQLELANQVMGLAELAAAAKGLRTAESEVAEAARRGADGMLADAARARSGAANRLKASAEQLVALLPAMPARAGFDAATIRAADALRRADAAMSQALDALEAPGDRSAAEKAMRQAAEALAKAASARAELPEK